MPCCRGDRGETGSSAIAGVLEELLQGDGETGLVGGGEELDAADGVAAEVEEVVVDADPVEAEGVGPEGGECLFGGGAGRGVGDGEVRTRTEAGLAQGELNRGHGMQRAGEEREVAGGGRAPVLRRGRFGGRRRCVLSGVEGDRFCDGGGEAVTAVLAKGVADRFEKAGRGLIAVAAREQDRHGRLAGFAGEAAEGREQAMLDAFAERAAAQQECIRFECRTGEPVDAEADLAVVAEAVAHGDEEGLPLAGGKQGGQFRGGAPETGGMELIRAPGELRGAFELGGCRGGEFDV